MQLFATLLLGHLIADFPLQTDWVVQFKKRHITGLALHASIHVGVTALLIRDPFHTATAPYRSLARILFGPTLRTTDAPHRQTIYAYPGGGGVPIVARENERVINHAA